MRYSTFVLLAALFTLGGCNDRSSKPQPSSDPLVRGLEEQRQAQEEDSTNHRLQARQAAIEHVKNHYPGWEIQGVSIYSNGGNDYAVGVDVSANEGRQTIRTNVELFVKDTGEKYWKTTFVPAPVGAKPFEFAIKAY